MKTLYLVLPCYNEELILENSAEKLQVLFDKMIAENKISEQSKICFVNDGSSDSSLSIIKKICENNRMFCYVSLTRNFGHQNAILAGMVTMLDLYDAVITLDADLQHDIEMIPYFWDLYLQGNDIVYGIRKSRKGESAFKKITGDMYYQVMRLFGVKMIKNHADYRLMSSRAVKVLEEYQETNLFLRGLVPTIGCSSSIIEYEEKPRLAGESKYTIKKMMKLGMDGITSFSIRPLQLIMGVGALLFLISVVMFVYTLISYIQNGTVKGWASTVAAIWMLGGIQLLALGIVGEYVGKIYMETKHRPRYVVDEVDKNKE